MRPDMKKVINERPRRKSSDKTPKSYARSQNKPFDDFPQKESISRKYVYNGKGETFRDGPLRKFLGSQVGRLWDNVYSEICANADIKSHGGYQVRELIGWMVELDVVVVDDVPYKNGYPVTSRSHKYFYVHPVSKLLCVAPPSKHRSKWVKEKKLPKVYEVDGILYHCHDDAWYRVKMVDLKDWTKVNLLLPMYIKDAIIGGSTIFYSKYDNGFLRKYGKNPKTNKIWYCIHKESANKKEIKKLKKLMEQSNT